MLKGNLTCENISRLILPYIDDKLTENQRNRVAIHLRNCPFCMEKYRIIKSLFDKIKQKNIQRAKKFQQYKLLSAYCDNEVSENTKDNIEASLALSCELTQKAIKINNLKKLMNYVFESQFANIELNMEKDIINRLKNDNIFTKIKTKIKKFKLHF